MPPEDVPLKRQNLLVITHRRSGTHLTIDAIRNNFHRYRQRAYLVFETLHPAHPEHVSLKAMTEAVETGWRVIKTHHRQTELNELPGAQAGLLRRLLNESQKVYVVRNGLDVMASLYEFRKGHDSAVQGTSFSDFIREPTFDPARKNLSRVEYWATHVREWQQSRWSEETLLLHFEDWIQEYQRTIRRVAQHTGLSPDWRKKDVRLAESGRRRSLERTWVEPRKGTVGDFANYFCSADLEYFWSVAGDVMRQVGYGEMEQESFRAVAQRDEVDRVA